MGEALAECIFCAIVAGKAPAHRVFEDDRLLVFMDIFPVALGHTLIIPKRHARDLLETDTADLEVIVAMSKRLAGAIHCELSPDGIGVYQLNGAAAGQTVFHYHMHLIPRTRGDPLAVHGRKPGDPETLAATASRLAKALQ